MAATLRHVAARLCVKSFLKQLPVVSPIATFHTSGCRKLFSADILGVEDFKRKRYEIKESLGDQKDRFRAMMEDYLTSSDKGTVFTTDLKTIVHICDTSVELDSMQNMIKHYHRQSSTLRFSTYNFGPVVMRLLYVLKKSDLAYKLFVDKELDGFFDQMSSFIILMDLLFEGQMYHEVIEVLDIISSKMLHGVRYPYDAVVLMSAACLRINSKESLEKCLKIINAIHPENVGQRCLIYTAVLALEQGENETAYKMLSHCRNKSGNSVVVDNVETLILIKLGKVNEAVQLWKTKLNEDDPESTAAAKNKFYFEHVADELNAAVQDSGDTRLQHELQHVMKRLKEQGCLQDVQLMEFIFRPVVRRRQLHDGYKNRRRWHVQFDTPSQPRGRQTYHKKKT